MMLGWSFRARTGITVPGLSVRCTFPWILVKYFHYLPVYVFLYMPVEPVPNSSYWMLQRFRSLMTHLAHYLLK